MDAVELFEEHNKLAVGLLLLGVIGAFSLPYFTSGENPMNPATGPESVGFCDKLQPTLRTNCTVTSSGDVPVRTCNVSVNADREAQFQLIAENGGSHKFITVSAGSSGTVTRNASKFRTLVAGPMNPDTGQKCTEKYLFRVFS